VLLLNECVLFLLFISLSIQSGNFWIHPRILRLRTREAKSSFGLLHTEPQCTTDSDRVDDVNKKFANLFNNKHLVNYLNINVNVLKFFNACISYSRRCHIHALFFVNVVEGFQKTQYHNNTEVLLDASK